MTEDGLYGKYEVQEDGEPVEDCFVLEPESDPAALEALRTYANETENRELRSDLRGWIQAIDERNDRSQDTGTDRKRDYRVECDDCESTYTPKGRTEPEECYNCGSEEIDIEVVR